MDHVVMIDSLERTPRAIDALVRPVSAQQARWKPAPEKWSILEVIAHLYDEEREDFRTRIDLALHHPDRPWPPIDPQGWVTQRDYAGKGPAATLEAFLRERANSLAWLRGLRVPSWDVGVEHPVAGRLAAGDLLAAWAAHDVQHIRQLARLHYEYLQHIAAPFSVRYAG